MSEETTQNSTSTNADASSNLQIGDIKGSVTKMENPPPPPPDND